MTTARNRTMRRDDVLARHELTYRDSDSDDAGSVPDRYLSIARSTIDASRLWGTNKDPVNALYERMSDEHPEDWIMERLYDLDHDAAGEPARVVAFTEDLSWTFDVVEPEPPAPASGGPLAVAVAVAAHKRDANLAEQEAERVANNDRRAQSTYLAELPAARLIAEAALAEFAAQLTWAMDDHGHPYATHPELPAFYRLGVFTDPDHDAPGADALVLWLQRADAGNAKVAPVRELADLAEVIR